MIILSDPKTDVVQLYNNNFRDWHQACHTIKDLFNKNDICQWIGNFKDETLIIVDQLLLIWEEIGLISSTHSKSFLKCFILL